MSAQDQFQGTMPVAERQKFDQAALASWMQAHVEGMPALKGVEQFRGGQSNPTFLLTLSDGRRIVMRCKPAPKAKLLPSAHAVEREFRIMKALGGVNFPVPRVLALCEDESVIGRAFFLMEYVEGRIFWDSKLPQIAKSERAAYFDEMNRVMAQLHTVDYQAIGLGDYGKPGNYFARQIERWTKQYKAAETEKVEAMDNLIAWLPKNIPEGDQTTIVHGDYRFDNMIFHPVEPKVLAVVDWELSTLGHPLADFSYNCLAWHMPPGERSLFGLDLQQEGIPTEAEYIAAYCRRTGRDRIDNWGFYIAFDFFKLAGILQGVYKRALDGIASNKSALEMGRGAIGLASIGWEVAQSR